MARHRKATAVLCRGKLAECNIADLLGIRLSTRRLITIDHRNFDPPWKHAAPPWLHGLATWATAARCIAVSDEIAKSARTVLRIPAARVTTCLNWVDPAFREVSREQRASAKIRFGLPADALVIGYHGRLAPEKRIDALIRAASSLNPAETRPWVLAIAGDGWKREELVRLAAECGVLPRIRFMGWQPDPAATVAAFDVAVLPSVAEGFPLGLMEAMGRGAVCLAHPMSSTRTLIRPGDNGLLADLSDPVAFARALAELTALPEATRARMGAAAAQTIEKDFSRARRLPKLLHALGVVPPDAAAYPSRTRNLKFVKADS